LVDDQPIFGSVLYCTMDADLVTLTNHPIRSDGWFDGVKFVLKCRK